MTFKTFIATALVTATLATTTLATGAHANDAARFELANNSGQRIDVIQVSPSSSDRWGRDLLGDRVLRNGAAVEVIPGGSGCQYDVRVIYHDASKETFTNLDLCRTTRISFANSRDYVTR